MADPVDNSVSPDSISERYRAKYGGVRVAGPEEQEEQQTSGSDSAARKLAVEYGFDDSDVRMQPEESAYFDQKVSAAASPRAAAIEDFRDAFRDYGIPEELAEDAFTASGGEKTDAAEREAFVNTLLDVKSEADEKASVYPGEEVTIEDVNDWKTVIQAAGAASERQRGSDISASEIKAAVKLAENHWQKETSQILAQYPGLTDAREARAIQRYAERRTWLVSKIPETWQRRLGLDAGRTYNNALEKGYEKLIEKKADALLKQRAKALQTLRGVDKELPPHLLPSKQYRAAELLTRSDQELRRLRPLRSEDYGAAVAAGQRAAQVERQPAQQAGQRTAPEIVREHDFKTLPFNEFARKYLPEYSRQEATAPAQNQAPALQAVNTTASPATRESVQVEKTPQQKALEAIREIQAQTPVDGYRSTAAKMMENRLIRQLQENRPTINLSAEYQGADQGRASTTHGAAVEANKDFIEATRRAGVPVDTGIAKVSAQKKSEVELSQQTEQNQAMQTVA